MSEHLEPMDVYATHRVPFDIAAYCRGHKFSIPASNVARAVRAIDFAKLALIQAEKRMEQAEAELLQTISRAREAMESSKTV